MKKTLLTKNQLRLLEKIKQDKFLTKNFYLTGGTALAAFYLHHRYSEDLDFFSEKEFDVASLNIFFQKIKKDIHIKSLDYQQSYNRNLYFVTIGKEVIKIEFTYFPFPRIEIGKMASGIPMDSILDIAVNKLFTIYQKSQARHYIDLYCIIKKHKWNIENLVKKVKIKFDWHIDYLQLGSQFLKAQETRDVPRMIIKIPDVEWRDFFLREAKKLKEKILK